MVEIACQYLPLVAGPDGRIGTFGDEDIDTRDLTSADRFISALRDLPRPAEVAGRLYVFRLP